MHSETFKVILFEKVQISIIFCSKVFGFATSLVSRA